MADEVAGIYCRLSLARMKDIHGRTIIDTTKVEDQERISRDICATRRWPLAAGIGYPEPNGVFTDNNRSAWQKNRRRPGWDAMLAAVEAGQLTRLAIYHGDRLVRQPYDLELLLNLADQRGIIIASATGDYQLDVAADRFVIRVLTASAAMASDDTSRRKKQGFARMAREGLAPVPGGQSGRGYGYEKDGRTPHPVEADMLRYAAEYVLAGESLTAICRELGMRSVSGAPLNYQSLKRILLRPRIAGLLTAGVVRGIPQPGDPGNWEPILGREQWELVRAVLLGRAEQYKDRPAGAAKYLLSGIATCWACKRPVQRQSAGRASSLALGYGCVTPGCRKVHRNMELLDTYVGTRVVERLNHPDNPPGRVPEHPGLAAELLTLTGARAELRAKIEDPAQPYVDLLVTRLARIEERITDLRGQTGDAARARLVGQHRGLSWEEWPDLPLATRRALVTAFWTIELLPSGRRGPGFAAADVAMTPRQDCDVSR